jgi:hypothetical protein
LIAARLGEAAQETSSAGAAFSLVSFFWLSKRKKLAAGQPPASPIKLKPP